MSCFVAAPPERPGKPAKPTESEHAGKGLPEERYFIASLPSSRLSPEQWLLVVRRHWGVETAHQALDVSFKEDKRPIILENPRATVVVAMLRRIASTLLTTFTLLRELEL